MDKVQHEAPAVKRAANPCSGIEDVSGDNQTGRKSSPGVRVYDLWVHGRCEPVNPGGALGLGWAASTKDGSRFAGNIRIEPDPANTNNQALFFACMEALRDVAAKRRSSIEAGNAAGRIELSIWSNGRVLIDALKNRDILAPGLQTPLANILREIDILAGLSVCIVAYTHKSGTSPAHAQSALALLRAA